MGREPGDLSPRPLSITLPPHPRTERGWIRLLVNQPLVFPHDIPGFFIGRDAERKRVAPRIITWMEALGMVSVPRVSIVVRKTYGQAYFNMGEGSSRRRRARRGARPCSLSGSSTPCPAARRAGTSCRT